MGGILSIQEAVHDCLMEASEAAAAKFRAAIRPIYAAKPSGDPIHIGSSILLSLREGRFLLTAAHVLDWADGTSLFLGAASATKPVPLSFDALVSRSLDGARAEDRVDFALAKLEGETGAELAGDQYVHESDISQSVAPTEGRTYTCLGYPNSKNRVTLYRGGLITPKLGIYTSQGRPEHRLPGIADDDLHILVDHDQKWSRDEKGVRVNSTALPGFSGGAIVDVGRLSDPAALASPRRAEARRPPDPGPPRREGDPRYAA